MKIALNEIITDIDILSDNYIIREGFVFSSLTYPANVYDAIVIRNPVGCDVESPLYPLSKKSLEDHISLIKEYCIEKAIVIAESINFIIECPSIKYISIIPAINKNGFDFSPLYEMHEIRTLLCQTCYGIRGTYVSTIDYSKIKGLLEIGISGKGHLNYRNLRLLRSLVISDYNKKDLTQLTESKNLDTLQMIQCKTKSLCGIGISPKMQCLYLYNNRLLSDISSLSDVKNSLKALRIQNCPKITDFSVLRELENLELLEITGSNVLENLNFLQGMKNLKTFIFDANILDGDLTPCLNVPHVVCLRSRKHYNLRNKDLPKGKFAHGNEDIEEWRRLE